MNPTERFRALRNKGRTGYGSRALAFVLLPLLFPQSRYILAGLPKFTEPDLDWRGDVAGDEPLRLLVIGDSTAAGLGLDSLREALPGHLAAGLSELTGRGVSWTVFARSGATTGEVRNFFLAMATREPFDVVFISTGVNDVMQLRTAAAFSADLALIIEGLKKAAPSAAILLAGIPRIERFPALRPPLATILGARAYRLNTAAHEVLRDHPEVTHVPPWPIETPEFFLGDGFHPSAIGYRAWARQSLDYWARRR